MLPIMCNPLLPWHVTCPLLHTLRTRKSGLTSSARNVLSENDLRSSLCPHFCAHMKESTTCETYGYE
ncbi:hypothetical protein GDO81_010071 [Engystomops pustulosus]|uniref:Uncharacterized protein n=1 Tax=Engystomops pustulosus TaxID=76066 RepID=A0AAV7BY52_ENGPU|nr:hypothetical protein GDO81_010071 [Engystomops pustulosus]